MKTCNASALAMSTYYSASNMLLLAAAQLCSTHFRLHSLSAEYLVLSTGAFFSLHLASMALPNQARFTEVVAAHLCGRICEHH